MRRLFCLLSILALAAPAAHATSYVMMSDENLVDQTPTIARVRVLGQLEPDLRPRTVYRATVVDTLKGAPGPEILVSVPGGATSTGLRWQVYGAPSFEPGEEALLFLDWREDGTYGIEQLLLGAFHERSVSGKHLALRSLSEATELGRAPGSSTEPTRDLDLFVDWIRDRVAGVERPADYRIETTYDEMAAIVDEFTLINNPGIRWFEFDSGGKVEWYFNPNGVDLSEQAFKQALNAWNAESKTPVNLVYKGKSGATSGLDSFDDLNVLVGGDPKNEMSGKFSCGAGGTLAIGGPWYDDSLPKKNYNGKSWFPALGADIVINDGAECHLSIALKGAEVFTHEAGHTLGLGHSCGDSSSPGCIINPVLDDATMRANAHFDGRGAAIREDDIGGLRTLYKSNTGGGGGGNPPAAPTGLLATAVSTNQVSMKWTDNATNETGYSIEMKTVGSVLSAVASEGAPALGDFVPVATLDANKTTYTQGPLDSAFHYVFRVQALGSNGKNSAYSEELDVITDTIAASCVEDSTTLCLNGDRFAVTATWETKDEAGVGQAVELVDGPKAGTGYFWFFNENNVEVVVKSLNSCNSAFHSFWVFASGLTNQGVVLVVVDTETGKIRLYDNSLNEDFKLVTDTSAFKTCDS